MPHQDALSTLQDVMAALTRISADSSSADALMRRVVDETLRITGATGAVVERLHEQNLDYVCVAGSIVEHLGLRLRVQGSLSGLCAETRSAQRCTDTESDPRVNREACRKIRARSLLAVPLLFGAEVLGVLKVTSEQLDAFGPMEQLALEFAASLIGAALGRQQQLDAVRAEHDRLSSELDRVRAEGAGHREAAFTDALTGLPNRRQFDAWLDEFDPAGPRALETAALCFIDLNGFKGINDRYGHLVGDALLVRVGEALRDCVNAHDRAARLGGDEFVALMHGLHDPRQQAAWLARRLLLSLQQRPVRCDGVELYASISIGIALRDAHGPPRGQWLSRADQAMYQAKAAGPGRYALYGELGERSA